MKKAILIYNPNSGLTTRKKRKKIADFSKIEKIFQENGYQVTFRKTEYAKHAIKMISELEEVDLVVSVGGDGTFNEMVTGNFLRNKKLLLAHLPYGTTNDIGTMFGLGKNLYQNLALILSGKVKKIDIFMVNGNPFIYVAGFGKLLNIPYETGQKLKKKIGYFAYLMRGAKDFLLRNIPLYEIEYEINGQKHRGSYSLALFTNTTRIAGMNHWYKNIRLNDSKFEVLLCSLKTKKEIMKGFLSLKKNHFETASGFEFYQTNSIQIKFLTPMKKPWCLDGEKMNEINHIYRMKATEGLEILVPKKVIAKLFVGD